MQSIFEAIVRHENDHTNLLRNLLDRDANVASAVLTYLLGDKEGGWDTASYHYMSQSCFMSDDGKAIPDIRIDGSRFRCLIEVKASPTVPFTEAQLRGYAPCFELGVDNHLCYLVPGGRKDFVGLPDDETSDNGTHVHRRSWAGLTEVLLRQVRARPDEVLLEVASFWERTFAVVGMTEINMDFLRDWKGEHYIAMRRLQRTVDQARKNFELTGFETEAELSGISEYGFYLKRDNRYEFWVGIWADLDAPLLFGYEQQRTSWRRPSPRPLPDLTFKNYDLWRLGPETWGDPNKLFQTVKEFRDKLNYGN